MSAPLYLALCLVAIAGAIWSDRMRGTSKEDGRKLYAWVYSAITGLCYAILLIRPDAPWQSWAVLPPALAAACALGSSGGGWGNILGPIFSDEQPKYTSTKPDGSIKDEREKFLGVRWQHGLFLRSAFAAALARGALWGLCFVPLGAWIMLPIMTVAFTAAPYAARAWLKGPLNTSAKAPSLEWQIETVRSGKMWARNEQIRAAVACALILLVKVFA